ncbi:SEA (Seh1-associated) complex subunit [Ciborinia camelliae]|nr:SEA (Seh1-associated) complex subunit [Ciborinia camelliae]
MNKGKIMRKLLGQPATTIEVSDTNNIDSPQLRPTASQGTVYSAGAPLTCLGRSPDGSRAVVAGPKVFKIVKTEGSTISEDIDLRASISSYSAGHEGAAATTEQLNIRAVRWSHNQYSSTIVTAGGNGRITVYDLNRAGGEGFEVARIQEHARQVHKLAINPFKGNWLLSASQDGSIKCFDLRDARRSVATYKCNADAVRDVKWSPTDGMEFACSTDAGILQKWDFRKTHAPMMKITAHNSAVFSISWHPDGDHIVSGGKDQQCHVWDMSKPERGQRARYSFTTPAPISNVCWRPACWTATGQGKRIAQVAVSYDDTSANRAQFSTVHLWDVARSAMPFKEIEVSNSAPTGILWSTRDLLWTVDKEGHFVQTDVAFSPKVIDRRSLSTFSFSPTGDVLMLLEERQAPKRIRPSINSPELSSNLPQHINAPSFAISRSDSEEDVVGSFLGPRRRKNHRRRHSGRLTHNLSTTPPNPTGMADSRVMSLEDAVQITGLYKPRQIMAIGHAPSTPTRTNYQYMSNCYLEYLTKNASEKANNIPLNVTIAATMEHFAKGAENLRYYRLAQTWRLLGFTMDLLLVRRAELHRQDRLQNPPRKEGTPKRISSSVKLDEEHDESNERTPRKIQQPIAPNEVAIHPAVRSIIADEIESTSNMTTPLVRPVMNSITEMAEAINTPMVENDTLALPPSVSSTIREPIPVPVSTSLTSEQTTSSIEGYDFYGMDAFKPAVDFVPPKKHPLRLDYSEQNSYAQRMGLTRHDSGESFQMFSTSNDSQSKYLGGGGSDSDAHSVRRDESLRERVSSWEGNTALHAKASASLNSRPSEESMEKIPEELPKIIVPAPRISSPPQTLRKPPPTSIIIEPAPENHSSDPNLIETDFLPWPNDNDTEFVIPPLNPITLVQRTIEFETQTGALNAAAIVLLLRRLLPPDTIDPIHAEAILRQYNHRLMSMQLFYEATLLRNLCVPLYPSIYASTQERVSVGFYCTECEKPLENDPLVPGSEWSCPRCRKPIMACPICQHRDDVPGMEGVQTWWYCGGCGHGGHTVCMSEWHAHAGDEWKEGEKYSGGMCPLDGCMHPCLEGRWREELVEEGKERRARELEREVKERTGHGPAGLGGLGRWDRGKSVRRDVREVGQSRAVEGVRVALGFGGGSGAGGGTGHMVERRRSVKVLAPGEENLSQ